MPLDSLHERFLLELLATARRLQEGPDPEVALEALIAAAQTLQDRLAAELAELRVEQTD